jgi:hypothetical protein
MMHHHQRNRPWLWALAVGEVFLIGCPALAQVPLPSPLVPLEKFSITGKASGSETNQTSAADYTVKFTLAPDRVLDPTIAAVLLRIETDAQAPPPVCRRVHPAGLLLPRRQGGLCGVRQLSRVGEGVQTRAQLRTRPDATAAELQRHAAAGQGRVAGAHHDGVDRGGRNARAVLHHVCDRHPRRRHHADQPQRREVGCHLAVSTARWEACLDQGSAAAHDALTDYLDD